MNSEQWDRLADWHGAWLDADAEGRRRLRRQLTDEHPDLLGHADDLVADPSGLSDFLETPAFVLAARRMARETTSLSAGAQIGPYRIVGLIAHGGMGVVYRATDIRLHRDVALKLLAPLDVPDESRVERFLWEARITASIDHPHVVKVFDVGAFEGHPYIVVELLDGETLRARMSRDRVSVAAARNIARDVAEGLVAAHAAGLVHRDLKPENIFLTRGGVTKILDFGIAKLAPGVAARRTPTATVAGVLLGTAAYLAPEQIRGEQVDARADLFALGSILFELLTGERAFGGEDTVDTLHAVLHALPSDRLRQHQDIPASLARITARLIDKAPASRFQSAADLAWALAQADDERSGPLELPRGHESTRRIAPSRWVLIGASVALAASLFVTWHRLMSPSGAGAPGALARFTWTLPQGTTLLSAPAVSPDGRRIAWTGRNQSGVPQVFVRDLSSLDAIAIQGTEGGLHPFWSPDSRALGFFARGKLHRVAIAGGTPVLVADAPEARGGTWSRSGVIVFAPDYRDTPLMRVSDRGGEATPVTSLDPAQEDVANGWPSFLPDGVHFLYSVVSLRDERRGVYVGSVDGPSAPSSQRLFASESGAMYASLEDGRGAVLSIERDHIEVRPFDPVRRVLEGDARTIGIEAIGKRPNHPALFSVSGGVMAYSAGLVPWGSRLVSVGRDGSNLQFLTDTQLSGFPRLSPDGRRLARTVVDTVRANPDIWLDDLERGTQERLTTSASFDVSPVWSPDGREVAYRSGALNEPTIGFAAAEGTGVTRTLACPVATCEPSDWSPDGTYLVVTVRGRDVWKVSLQTEGTAQPLLNESFTERDARISPDGRWLAYVSDESGRPEVSVCSLNGPARRVVVSTGGGDQPVWRHDGAELFFTGGTGRLHAVSVRSDRQRRLAFGAPTTLGVPPFGERHWGTTYDVSAHGDRVYLWTPGQDRAPDEFSVVMNWSGLLK